MNNQKKTTKQSLFNISEEEEAVMKLSYLIDETEKLIEKIPKRFKRIDTEQGTEFWYKWKKHWENKLNECEEKEEWLVLDNLQEAINSMEKLNNIKKYKGTNNELHIDKAKEYPIKQILQMFNIPLIKNFFKLRNEKTPSCYVYKSTNTWRDFGSSEGGDSIDLYQKLANVSFREAVKELCG